MYLFRHLNKEILSVYTAKCSVPVVVFCVMITKRNCMFCGESLLNIKYTLCFDPKLSFEVLVDVTNIRLVMLPTRSGIQLGLNILLKICQIETKFKL
jgi:hypothetical protein